MYPNCHIVMVDDNEVDAILIQRCIEDSNLAIPFISFTDGNDFLQYMDEVAKNVKPMPKLILLDINMPRMNGFEVLGILRKRPEFQDTPEIIFYSHSDNPADRERAVKLKARFQEKNSSRKNTKEFLESLIAN